MCGWKEPEGRSFRVQDTVFPRISRFGGQVCVSMSCRLRKIMSCVEKKVSLMKRVADAYGNGTGTDTSMIS